MSDLLSHFLSQTCQEVLASSTFCLLKSVEVCLCEQKQAALSGLQLLPANLIAAITQGC